MSVVSTKREQCCKGFDYKIFWFLY